MGIPNEMKNLRPGYFVVLSARVGWEGLNNLEKKGFRIAATSWSQHKHSTHGK